MIEKSGILITDVQNDFCPGGALAVEKGDEIIPQLNKYIEYFQKNNLPIFASRDWHPPKTKHFKTYDGKWPAHCIQNTEGAAFHSALALPESSIIISKGMDPEREGYTVFQGYSNEGEAFDDVLKSLAVKTLYIGGIATDYCVKDTVIGALNLGYQVRVLIDAIKGIDTEDSENAIEEMKNKGAKLIQFEDLGKE